MHRKDQEGRREQGPSSGREPHRGGNHTFQQPAPQRNPAPLATEGTNSQHSCHETLTDLTFSHPKVSAFADHRRPCCMLSCFSSVRLFSIPWTVANQAPPCRSPAQSPPVPVSSVVQDPCWQPAQASMAEDTRLGSLGRFPSHVWLGARTLPEHLCSDGAHPPLVSTAVYAPVCPGARPCDHRSTHGPSRAPQVL